MSPLPLIFGRNKIPAQSAKKLIKAVQKIQGAKKLKDVNLWQALEVLADKFNWEFGFSAVSLRQQNFAEKSDLPEF